MEEWKRGEEEEGDFVGRKRRNCRRVWGDAGIGRGVRGRVRVSVCVADIGSECGVNWVFEV